MLRRVLEGVTHEIIVVDDSSTDGTIHVAKRIADKAVRKKREGQTKGLLFGMKIANYPLIITIDADLENDPQYIPRLLQLAEQYDLIVASRTELPRVSERVSSIILGRFLNVTDVFSNFRLYRKDVIASIELKGGETFGAEFLISAKKRGFKIGEIFYDPPPRRKNPRIGGNIRANLRIFWALLKSIILYLFF